MERILHNRNAMGEVLEIFLVDDGFLEFKVEDVTVTTVSLDLLEKVIDRAKNLMEQETRSRYRRHM